MSARTAQGLFCKAWPLWRACCENFTRAGAGGLPETLPCTGKSGKNLLDAAGKGLGGHTDQAARQHARAAAMPVFSDSVRARRCGLHKTVQLFCGPSGKERQSLERPFCPTAFWRGIAQAHEQVYAAQMMGLAQFAPHFRPPRKALEVSWR